MILQTWGDVIVASLQQVWASLATFIPLLIGALIVFLIGWVVAVALGKVVEQVVRTLRVDALLMKLDVGRAVERAGWKLNSGAFVGWLLGLLASGTVPFDVSVRTIIVPAVGIWILGMAGALVSTRRVAKANPLDALGGNA